MAYKACENCGTKLRSWGACPNCHEELVIHEEQIAGSDESYAFPPSPEFADKVKEQRREVKGSRRAYLDSL